MVSTASLKPTVITPDDTHLQYVYIDDMHRCAITSNLHVRHVSRCHLQSHLPLRDTTRTPSDALYMHFIIENVTGEHLQCCHNLITVCKNDTAAGAILNTNSEEDFSRQICTLSDSLMPVCEIAVSTTMCFHIILRGVHSERGGWGSHRSNIK